MTQPQAPSSQSTTVTQDSWGFFIPNLCAPQPVLVMVLLVELLVLVHVLANSSLLNFSWDLFAGYSLFAQWVVLLSALMLCTGRRHLNRLSLPWATVSCMLLVSLATLVSSLLTQTLFVPIIEVPHEFWWTARNVLIANVLAAIVLRQFYLQQQLRMRKHLELQARLDSLRARIRPHFLFNTLNSIASLIMSRPDVAEQAVEDLAELFRASLKENHGETTVADEVQLTKLYLGIEQLRLEDRLQVAWHVDKSTLDLQMPSLVLQPLVENAIYHGVAQIPAGGCIEINIRREKERLHASVQNPVPATQQGPHGNQMALSNVKQRLSATYGPTAKLEVILIEGAFRVEFFIPDPSML